MRFSKSLFSSFLLLAAGAVEAASSSWGFDEGSVAVISRKGGSEGFKEKLDQKSPLSKPVTLGASDTIKISLTTKEGGKPKRPHQAFVMLKDEDEDLEAPFPMTVKENGKAVVQISHKDLPVQLLLSSKPLKASIIVASFGSAKGLITPLFDLSVVLDPLAPRPTYKKPVRYGKLPEIHHTFRPDPTNPPMFVSVVFALGIVATVPALFMGWLYLGANLKALPAALGRAPVSHVAFFGSIVAMEFVFFLYYTTWNLLQVLPLMCIIGAVAVLSGTKALGEIQQRRLQGAR